MHELRHGRQGLESRSSVDSRRVAFFDPDASQDQGCHVTPVFPGEEEEIGTMVYGMSIVTRHPHRRGGH